ncbi:glycoside hydrolase family 3 C-terminal domain-containing protein [Streptomyces sp. Wh19]|uniref:glycoside hydrolase family 3 C-terminal domain-containing protein n=1 Tax=Streptomyces sp. Wh19 TaxID=3076629 RepID=UPI00295899C6|nr:glycoside hydrolase family 3 C-terminal domain-containing protein [Streptomyces sp. Wh19]MDV9194619.1 glycoside hydrolase family 3 C-terminal domain-containing protein [Streptomyces sp. Wh19]
MSRDGSGRPLASVADDEIGGAALELLWGPSATDKRPKLYVEGLDTRVAARFGELVDAPAEADLAVLCPFTPYEFRESRFEQLFHSGRLDFTEEEPKRVLDLLDAVPPVVCLNLERPAAIPEIAERAAALIVDFGASDEALLDVAFGRARAEGRLPYELPGSMAAVERPGPTCPTTRPIRFPPSGPIWTSETLWVSGCPTSTHRAGVTSDDHQPHRPDQQRPRARRAPRERDAVPRHPVRRAAGR